MPRGGERLAIASSYRKLLWLYQITNHSTAPLSAYGGVASTRVSRTQPYLTILDSISRVGNAFCFESARFRVQISADI